jgi:hypothetical protein
MLYNIWVASCGVVGTLFNNFANFIHKDAIDLGCYIEIYSFACKRLKKQHNRYANKVKYKVSTRK